MLLRELVHFPCILGELLLFQAHQDRLYSGHKCCTQKQNIQWRNSFALHSPQDITYTDAGTHPMHAFSLHLCQHLLSSIESRNHKNIAYQYQRYCFITYVFSMNLGIPVSTLTHLFFPIA